MTAAASPFPSACTGRCRTRGSRPSRRSWPPSRGDCSPRAASARRQARSSSACSAASATTGADGVRLLHLLAGSVVLRPYVFVFLAVYLVAAVTRIGWWRTAAFTAIAWVIAYAAEFSSTRTGFPFGLYVYVDATRGRELWLANVPFFDSLSFSFLCYLGYALAIFLYAPLVCGRGDFQVADTRAIRTSWRVLVTGAFLTTLMDLVIDPLTEIGRAHV